MKITDALKGEHGVFYAQFSFIEGQLAGATLATIKSLGAMLASALVPHAQVENDILFPAIEEKIGAGGPTTVMRLEHSQIEGMLEELPSADEGQARGLMRDLFLAARTHFAKEENVLFPMAEQLVEERKLEELGIEWAARRGVVLT